jgi:multidrug efflux system outer membrane protein
MKTFCSRQFISLSTFALTISALTGCVVGSKYARPDALPSGAISPRYADAPTETAPTNEWKIAEPAAGAQVEGWWLAFQDPELNRLEELGSNLNQNLALATARLEEARAELRVSRAGLFPNLDFTPGYSREHTSANTISRGVSSGVSYNNFSVPFQASWELDLWGRVRNQVKAARERLQAGSDDVAAARLALEAEIAADYFSLSALDSEYAIVQQSIESFQRSLQLTVNRRKGGIASDLDVSQAETQLKSAEALLPAIELQRAQTRNALAVVCGQEPAQFAVAIHPLPQVAATVAAGIPSELLERRPDIAAAERRMAAANADIGVAKAAFYPRVTLNGLAGFESINAGSLFNWSSRIWAFGPNLDLPIFNAGRNRAELALSRATFAANVAAYRQTVLAAFQEVEDQLAAQRLLDADLAAEEAAFAAAQRTLAIAQNRYKSGLVTYLEVASAQSSALDHERTVVRLRAQRLTARVALIKALGGGWQSPELASASK